MPSVNHQKTDMFTLLEDICSNAYGKSVYENYSGRGMYGDTCFGIVTDNPAKVIEEAAILGLRGAQMDSWGRDTIVYWPRPRVSNECREAYPKDESED